MVSCNYRTRRAFVCSGGCCQTNRFPHTRPFVNGKQNRIFRSAWLNSFVDVWITPKAGRSRYFQKRSRRSKCQQGVSGSFELQRAKGFHTQSPPATEGRGWCGLPRKYSPRTSLGQIDLGACPGRHSDRIEGLLEGTVRADGRIFGERQRLAPTSICLLAKLQSLPFLHI